MESTGSGKHSLYAACWRRWAAAQKWCKPWQIALMQPQVGISEGCCPLRHSHLHTMPGPEKGRHPAAAVEGLVREEGKPAQQAMAKAPAVLGDILESFDSHFCRRCRVYNCLAHRSKQAK